MSSSRESALYAPQVLAILSFVYICGKLVWTLRHVEGGSSEAATEEAESGIALDGPKIFAFRLFRLSTVFALLSMEVFLLSDGHTMYAKLFQPGIYVSLRLFKMEISSLTRFIPKGLCVNFVHFYRNGVCTLARFSLEPFVLAPIR